MLAKLAREHVAVGSINSPMPCMMKEDCAQCLQRHIDPVTGRHRVHVLQPGSAPRRGRLAEPERPPAPEHRAGEARQRGARSPPREGTGHPPRLSGVGSLCVVAGHRVSSSSIFGTAASACHSAWRAGVHRGCRREGAGLPRAEPPHVRSPPRPSRRVLLLARRDLVARRERRARGLVVDAPPRAHERDAHRGSRGTPFVETRGSAAFGADCELGAKLAPSTCSQRCAWRSR